MSKSEEIKFEKELDCSNAGRGVWLVKVPKYIAKKWLKGKENHLTRKWEITKLFPRSQQQAVI